MSVLTRAAVWRWGLIGMTLVFSGALQAQEVVSRAEFEALKVRLAQLEKIIEVQQAVIERQKEGEEVGKVSGSPSLEERLAISGVVEVEAGYTHTRSADAGKDSNSSDISLATVEIGVDAQLTEWMSASAVLLWEEDDTESVDLDTATIFLGNRGLSSFYGEVGKMYVPFGPCEARHVHCAWSCGDTAPVYESSFITDPIGLELAETRETAVQVGMVKGPVDVSLTVFNGDISESGDESDHIETAVASAQIAGTIGDLALAGGVSYITNIADSDGISGRIKDETGGMEINDEVGGLNLWMGASIGRFGLLADYVTALNDFAAGELHATNTARPRTWNLEATVALNDRLSLACKYERADDVFDWLHETRYGLCASYLFLDTEAAAATVAIEYLRGKYDDVDDTQDDTLTLQMAVEF